MSNVLLWTDLHFHPHKKQIFGSKRIDDCVKVVDWVFETAQKRKIKNIIFGGDFYHDRYKIEVYTYQKGFESIYKWMKTKEFNLYLLLGNHDLWYNDSTSVTSIYPFSSMPNCEVIFESKQLNIDGKKWDFIPFTHNPLDDLKKLKQNQGNYCVGHLAVDGAILHGNTVADVAVEYEGDMVTVDKKVFEGYEKVFLGHYHAQQRLDKVVEYIGSPLELSFGEANQEKHIIVFDQENNKCEYVVNDFSPKHLVLDPNKLDGVDIENNFVKVFVDDISSTEVVEIRDKLSKNTGSLEIKQKKVVIDKDVIDNAKNILFKEDEMLTQWVKENETDLDEEKLLAMGKKLCEKTEI